MKNVPAVGSNLIIARIGIVFSPYGGTLSKLATPVKYFVGGALGHGRQWSSWIHYDDLNCALQFLIESPTATGTYNMTAPNPASNKTVTKMIGKVLKRPTIIPVPAFALRLALGELAEILLTGQKVVPQKLQTEGFHFNYPELQPALQQLLHSN